MTIDELSDQQNTLEDVERSDRELRESIMWLEKSEVQLKNRLSREKTMEDAIGGYDGLVKNSHRIIEEGLHGQATTLRAMGRADNGNTQWGTFPQGSKTPCV